MPEMKMPAEDRILSASEYPHWDARFPESGSMIRERGGLSDAAKNKILGENAARLYGV
jgi:predicted TIM-barrel fold metal-dependent hydrolase